MNIITIEDPIEMVHDEFNQVAVRPEIDVTFANALRTVLRQDPDIIMVGEIRDTETAEHAVQAALTGHLVLSTLHTNDAPSSITRLLDLKVPGFLITSTVIGILAQRLVRVICSHCTEEYAPSVEEAMALGVGFETLAQVMLKRGRGCLHCRQTGYSGRDGIFEILPMTDTIRRLVAEQADSPRLFEAGRAAGMRTLREAAIEKGLSAASRPSARWSASPENNLSPRRPKKASQLAIALIEHSSDAIALVDEVGTVLYANPATARLLGRALADIIGTNVFRWVITDDMLAFSANFAARLAQPRHPCCAMRSASATATARGATSKASASTGSTMPASAASS